MSTEKKKLQEDKGGDRARTTHIHRADCRRVPV